MQNETQDNAEIIIPEFGYSHYAHVWDDKTSNMSQTEKGDEVCVSACVCMCEFRCACGLWALKYPKICLDCRSNRIMYMRAFQKRNVPVKNCNMRKHKYTPCHKPKMEMRCVCVCVGGFRGACVPNVCLDYLQIEIFTKPGYESFKIVANLDSIKQKKHTLPTSKRHNSRLSLMLFFIFSYFVFFYQGSACCSSPFPFDGGCNRSQLHNRPDRCKSRRSSVYLIMQSLMLLFVVVPRTYDAQWIHLPPLRFQEGSFAFGGRGCGGCKKHIRRKKLRFREFDSTLGTSPCLPLLTIISCI